MMYPTNILGVISRTSQSGATVIVGVAGRVGVLAFAGNGGDGALGSRVIGYASSFYSHVAEGTTLRVRVLTRHIVLKSRS